MKVIFEIEKLTKGFTLTKKENDEAEFYVFESNENLGAFLMDYFTRPKRPKVIRRKKSVQNDFAQN